MLGRKAVFMVIGVLFLCANNKNNKKNKKKPRRNRTWEMFGLVHGM